MRILYGFISFLSILLSFAVIAGAGVAAITSFDAEGFAARLEEAGRVTENGNPEEGNPTPGGGPADGNQPGNGQPEAGGSGSGNGTGTGSGSGSGSGDGAEKPNNQKTFETIYENYNDANANVLNNVLQNLFHNATGPLPDNGGGAGNEGGDTGNNGDGTENEGGDTGNEGGGAGNEGGNTGSGSGSTIQNDFMNVVIESYTTNLFNHIAELKKNDTSGDDAQKIQFAETEQRAFDTLTECITNISNEGADYQPTTEEVSEMVSNVAASTSCMNTLKDVTTKMEEDNLSGFGESFTNLPEDTQDVISNTLQETFDSGDTSLKEACDSLAAMLGITLTK